MRWRPSDAQIAVIIIASYALLFAFAGLWYWVVALILIAAAVGIAEAIAIKQTDLTISKRFAAFRERHRAYAIVIAVALTLGWAGLLVHLFVID